VKLDDFNFTIERLAANEDCPVILSISPEDFTMSKDDSGGIKNIISDSIVLGLNTHFVVKLSGGQEI
jgi:iron(III) transport system ATP-binding protein